MSHTVWIGAGVALAILIIALYNSLTGRRNQVEFAFASVDVQLKKRFDLIPNLVATCEKYMGFEAKVLQDLTATRTAAMNAKGDEKIKQDGLLGAQLRSLFAVAENYPNLKAIESFTILETSLNEVEEQLSAARRTFNAAVTEYNNAIQMFPSNIVAKLMGLQPRAWFEAAPDERAAVKVWS